MDEDIEELLDELGPERDPIPSRRPAGSEAAYRHGERLTDLEREYMRTRDTLREATDRVRSQPSSREARQVHEAARRRFHSLSQQISPAGESRIRELIPDELFDDGLGPEYDPIPSRRPPGSEAAYRYGPESGYESLETRDRSRQLAAQEQAKFDRSSNPRFREIMRRNVQRHTGVAEGLSSADPFGPERMTEKQHLRWAKQRGAGPNEIAELERNIELRRSQDPGYIRYLERRGLLDQDGFMRGVAPTARSTAARGLSTAMGVAASPIIDYALDPESRTPVQFARAQEEAITGMVPGLVSPSELPPPAVLSPDRLKAVEATQGLVGVAQDFESGVVTEQEVRAYVANKFAKGDKLPAWAEKITSMKNGRLSIKPVNPRTKARQEAAKRPHNPRMGQTKRKYGSY